MSGWINVPITAAHLARQKREQEQRREQLLLIAKKARLLAEDALSLGVYELGRSLLESAEFAERLWKVGTEL